MFGTVLAILFVVSTSLVAFFRFRNFVPITITTLVNATLTEHQKYSNFRCIHLGDQRSCLFRDVCIVNGTVLPLFSWHLQYYEDPTVLPEPLLDGRGSWIDFPRKFVSIRRDASGQEVRCSYSLNT
jgi:hypothetical protein